MKKIILVSAMFILALMVGCQTAAQKQVSFIQESAEATKQKMLAFVQKIQFNPA